jgi:hypothetical protein
MGPPRRVDLSPARRKRRFGGAQEPSDSNVNKEWYDYGDGHANGAIQALTARPANVPGAVIAGSAGGFLRQGEYMQLEEVANHARFLNTLGSAAGLRNANGELISGFGDPAQDRTPLSERMA